MIKGKKIDLRLVRQSDIDTLFVQYLFASKKINRLQLTVIPGNGASKRVAQKCGFKSEGIIRQAIFHRGKHADLEMFSLLREELESW